MSTAELWVRAEGMYGLAGYQFRPWLQGTLYYALEYPNLRDKSGRTTISTMPARAVRFDINPHWIFKLEAHYMRGTAAIARRSTRAPRARSSSNQWGLFAAKTTVYF